MRPVVTRFLLEVRRRGLLKVATAYLIVTWLVLEIGHTLFLVFDLPHQALQLIFVLLALGFPVVLLGTWQGWFSVPLSQAEASPSETHASAHHEGPWLAMVFGTVALFAVAVAIGVRFFGMGGPSSSHTTHSQAVPAHQVAADISAEPATLPAFNPPAHSIAVLPFVNMSGDTQQEYFSDGLAEELLNSLVRISQLKVAARTSSFAFKHRDVEVGDIARKLNVGAILEGSVRTSGTQVRITVQLVDAANGYHLWSQTYDRQLDDIFQVQADIATNVVRQLQAALLLGNPALPRHTPSAEAYAAYLQGNYFWFGLLQREQAIAYYEQALELDERYANAMVGLARARFGPLVGSRADTDVSKARQLIERALAADPQLAEAYVARALIERLYDFNWAAAEASLMRARELEPGNFRLLVQAASLAETVGRFEEALALFRQALERDPLYAEGYVNVGRLQMVAGQHAAAEATFRKYVDLTTVAAASHYVLAVALTYQNEPERALAEAELEPEPIFRLQALAGIYHRLHRQRESDAALRELIDKYARYAAFRIAEVYAYRGQADEAMRWLEQAYRNRDGDLTRLLSSPLSRTSLAQHPRYQAFLRKMNLPRDAG